MLVTVTNLSTFILGRSFCGGSFGGTVETTESVKPPTQAYIYRGLVTLCSPFKPHEMTEIVQQQMLDVTAVCV
eukprot:199020-Amphidinium_carterae.1